MQVAVRGEEVQPSGGDGLFQVVQEAAPEYLRQHPDREKEPRPTGDPPFSVGRDAAARDEKMNVRVMQEVLSPGVQHTEETDLRTQMFRISGDRAQRF
jgi:hypothetical protein